MTLHKRRATDRTPVSRRADPTETAERIGAGRQFLLEDGDVLIVRTGAGLTSASDRFVYELRLRGHGPTGERFASSEHAIARGEQLALLRRVRLLYVETLDGPPHLLKNYRPS